MRSEEPSLHELAVEVAVIKAKLEGMNAALLLQAKVYESRLQDLNHAHDQAREALATFMPRELADRNWKDVGEWKIRMEREHATFVTAEQLEKTVQSIDARIALLTEYRQNIMGRFSALSDAWGWVVGFVGMVVAAVAIYFRK